MNGPTQRYNTTPSGRLKPKDTLWRRRILRSPITWIVGGVVILVLAVIAFDTLRTLYLYGPEGLQHIGMCVAPNDGMIACDKLRQNPGKTDWGPWDR